MHALHPRNLFALVCLLLLTASAAAATPANHDALMTDGEYRKAFEAYSTTDQEAGKRLDAQDFAAVQKVVQAEMAEWAEMEISAGSSETEAWSNAYATGRDSLNSELMWDWLRRHPEGVQGFYRMQSKTFDGWMTVRKEKNADMYAVHIVASQKSTPFNSGELDGVGRLKDNSMQVADQSDEKNPVQIAFHGETATIVEPEAFKKSGALGSGVNTDTPYEMIRFGIWHNFMNDDSHIQPCAAYGCPWGSLTIDCAYVKDSLQHYFGYNLRQCLSATHPDSSSPYDKYQFDGTRYHFEGAAGEAVYYTRVNEARQRTDGLIEMKGIVYNADDKKDILGNVTALAKPHTWKGKNTLVIVSLKTQFKE